MSAGSLNWRADLRSEGNRLLGEIDAAGPDRFAEALDAEARRRLAAFMDGVLAYRSHPYRRRVEPPPAIWQEGTTRLLDYGAASRRRRAGGTVLVVPSLVNRYYVLDLDRGRSMMRYMAQRGMRPLMVDWDAPGPEERRFGLTDYVAGRLERALARATEEAGGPVSVVGYCMGGNLALALALRRPELVDRVAALATPWDFHAGKTPTDAMATVYTAALLPMIATFDELPTDAIQSLFAALDPVGVVSKFRRFPRLDPDSTAARLFVALEDWLNDGVPLAGPVAEETLIGWYAENRPGRGEWRIAGVPVRPQELRRPLWVAIPSQDRIVPPASASALADVVPHAVGHRVPAGHIGMAVGGRAREALWKPLVDWLKAG
ncbi:MAG: alpha/beta fold hydrolase [Acetobacterales bacterium]